MDEMKPTSEFEEQVRKAMHVPDANPDFVKQLRNQLVKGPAAMKPRTLFRPVWAMAFVLILAILILGAPGIAAAFGRVFGYVPDVGLVESTNGLRILAEPASVTRDGVTLTITQVFVYEDHVELTYEVNGIDPVYGNTSDTCGAYHPDNNFWSDADADLRLPDGTVVRRDYAGEFQSENRYAMKPIYAIHIPAEVTEMTMVLKCLPFTKLGAVPQDWEVPFKLISIPAGTVVGHPVIEVEQPTEEVSASSTAVPVSTPRVVMTLERIVPIDSATIFYLNFHMANHDPSLISIMPVGAYMIDSQRQRIQLIGNFVWQPFDHRDGSPFEFVSASKPADGPFTIFVEKTIAYYAPLYTDPPQATPEELSFTFDAGADPQHGQAWNLDEDFQIAGHDLKVTSARAVTYEDIPKPEFDPLMAEGSQGFDFGYQFAVEADPAIKMNVEMDVISEKYMCLPVNFASFVPENSSLLYNLLCRDGYPAGEVTITIREFSVLLDEELQVEWKP
jgi:hypothetical protein